MGSLLLSGQLCIAGPPPKAPYDPMSFPPGLIPALVRDKALTDPPYSPLSPLDIERAGLPPATPPDAYLASRLDKFTAEIRVNRPRMLPMPCCAALGDAPSM